MRVSFAVMLACAVGCSGGHPAGPNVSDDDGDADDGDPNAPLDIDPTDDLLGDGMTFLHVVCAGDSLTGNAAYRGAISGELTAHGRSVDLLEVSQTGSSSAIANALPGRLADVAPPDVGVIWTGLDDALAAADAAATLSAIEAMVDHLRDANPAVIVVVAEVPPVSNDALNAAVNAIDDGLPGLVASLQRDGSPLTLVTVRDTFDPTAETDDGTHPNDAGGSAIGHLVDAAFEPDI